MPTTGSGSQRQGRRWRRGADRQLMESPPQEIASVPRRLHATPLREEERRPHGPALFDDLRHPHRLPRPRPGPRFRARDHPAVPPSASQPGSPQKRLDREGPQLRGHPAHPLNPAFKPGRGPGSWDQRRRDCRSADFSLLTWAPTFPPASKGSPHDASTAPAHPWPSVDP
jgi:hypothetical protein